MEWRSGVFIERLKGQCRQALRGQKCVRDEPGGKERKEERKRSQTSQDTWPLLRISVIIPVVFLRG